MGENEEELSDLVKWARENMVTLTPRGKATSGYGGAVPVKGGVVIDFYRMKKIIDIDTSALTGTVQAGVVFERLDNELKKHGLTLKLYPSSYPPSNATARAGRRCLPREPAPCLVQPQP